MWPVVFAVSERGGGRLAAALRAGALITTTASPLTITVATADRAPPRRHQILNVMMINCPGGSRKADDSDHPLQEAMLNFTVNQIR